MSGSRRWSFARRAGAFLLNCWLVFHVFAVFIAPGAMPPVSPLLRDGYELARPYNDALFLNHGYHFFAPDPGASSLISWKADRQGDAPLTGRFPTTAIRPRLLYHRYFMLAENIWAFDEETQSDMLEAYARELARRNGVQSLSLQHLSHEPSSIMRIQAGGRLDDPEMFTSEDLATYQFAPSGGARAAARSSEVSQ